MLDLTKPFAVIQKEDAPTVLILSGPVRTLGTLAEIPRKQGQDAAGRRYDTLSLVPFSQIKEKGFEARQGDEDLPCMSVEEQREVPVADFLAWVPRAEIALEGETRFDESEDAFREAVRRI